MTSARFLFLLPLLLFVACGGSSAVQVEVRGSDDEPIAGASVLVSNEDGSVNAVVATDAEGIVKVDVPHGASVTVFYDEGDDRSIETRFGVRGGDALRFDVDSDDDVVPATGGTLDLVPPPDPPPAERYEYDFGCQRSNIGMSPAMQPLYTWCGDPETGTVDVLLTAYVGDIATGYAVQYDVPLTTDAHSPVTFPDGWRTESYSATYTLTNPPAWATAIATQGALRHGDDFDYLDYSDPEPLVPGASSTLSFGYVGGQYVEGTALYIRLQPDVLGMSGYSALSYMQSPVADETIDLGALLLPARITSLTLTQGTPRPELAFTVEGNLARADKGAANLYWSSGAESFGWELAFAPETPSPIIVPEIPDALVEYRPPTDGSIESPTLRYVDFGFASGYASARRYVDVQTVRANSYVSYIGFPD